MHCFKALLSCAASSRARPTARRRDITMMHHHTAAWTSIVCTDAEGANAPTRATGPHGWRVNSAATPRLSSASLPSDDDPVGCLTLALRSWRPEAPRREPPETVHAHNEVAIPWHCACCEPVLSCAVTDWSACRVPRKSDDARLEKDDCGVQEVGLSGRSGESSRHVIHPCTHSHTRTSFVVLRPSASRCFSMCRAASLTVMHTTIHARKTQ